MRELILMLAFAVTVFAYDCPGSGQLPSTCSCEETDHGIVAICNNASIAKVLSALEDKIVDILKIHKCNDSSTSMETAPVVYIRNLTITECDFRQVYIKNFEHLGTRLRLLNLENNTFHALPYFGQLHLLNKLEIGFNDLSTMTSDTFASMKRLKTLRMNNANLLLFPTAALNPLRNSLESLDLSRNLFKDVSVFTLSSFRLKFLDVSYNLLTSIKVPSFWEMSSLHELRLQGNQLTELVTIHNMANLTYLDLSNNNINKISDGFFEGIQSVQTVDLSSNAIVEIPILSALSNLTTLNLDQNHIESLGERTFDSNPKLTAISCRRNRISHISANTFTAANNSIKVLFLNNNTIHTVEKGAFGMLQNLTELGLSHNHRIELSNVSHPGLKQVFRLDIGSTNLKTLKKNDFDGMIKLEWLDVRNNSLERIEDGTFSEQMGTILISVASKQHSPTIARTSPSPTSTTIALPPATEQRP
uniref:LRRNT domain-containing protein n=1 Tax=Panagrellus redivivus TaxID=6233 RepID=A0A7E4W8Y4_PANRE